MKKLNPMSKNMKKISLLAMGITCFCAHGQLTLKIDENALGNTPMPVFSNVDYDSFGHELTITAKYPLICNKIENSSILSTTTANILSPNGPDSQNYINTTAGVVGLWQNMSYDLSNKTLNVVSENVNKSLCLTSTFHDVIYASGLQEDDWVVEYPNHFKYYTGIEQEQPVNSQFDTGVEYVNTSDVSVEVDLIEFWPTSNVLPVYVVPNGIFCRIYKPDNSFYQNCPMNFSELGRYEISGLLPGYKVKTENTLVINENSEIGEYLYLMTAVFTKVPTLQGQGQNMSFQSVEFIESKVLVAP